MDAIDSLMADHLRALARDRSPEAAAAAALAMLRGCCRVYCELRASAADAGAVQAELMDALHAGSPEGVFPVRH